MSRAHRRQEEQTRGATLLRIDTNTTPTSSDLSAHTGSGGTSGSPLTPLGAATHPHPPPARRTQRASSHAHTLTQPTPAHALGAHYSPSEVLSIGVDEWPTAFPAASLAPLTTHTDAAHLHAPHSSTHFFDGVAPHSPSSRPPLAPIGRSRPGSGLLATAGHLVHGPGPGAGARSPMESPQAMPTRRRPSHMLDIPDMSGSLLHRQSPLLGVSSSSNLIPATPPKRGSLSIASSGASTPSRSPQQRTMVTLSPAPPLLSGSSSRASSDHRGSGTFGVVPTGRPSPSTGLFPSIAGVATQAAHPAILPQVNNAADVPDFDLDDESTSFAPPPPPRRSFTRVQPPQVAAPIPQRTTSVPSSSAMKPSHPRTLAPLVMHPRRLFNNVTAAVVDMGAAPPLPPSSPTHADENSMFFPRMQYNMEASDDMPTMSGDPLDFRSPLHDGRRLSPGATPRIHQETTRPEATTDQLQVSPSSAMGHSPFDGPVSPELPAPADFSLESGMAAMSRLHFLHRRLTNPPMGDEANQALAEQSAPRRQFDFDLHVDDGGLAAVPRRWRHPNARLTLNEGSGSSDSDDEAEGHKGRANERNEADQGNAAADNAVPDVDHTVAPLIAALSCQTDSTPASPANASSLRSSPTRRKRRDTGSMAMASSLAEQLLNSKRAAATATTLAPPTVDTPPPSTSTLLPPPSPSNGAVLVASALPAHMKLKRSVGGAGMAVTRHLSTASVTSGSLVSSAASSLSVSRQLSVDPASTSITAINTRASSVSSESEYSRSSVSLSSPSAYTSSIAGLEYGGSAAHGHWDTPRRSSIVIAPLSPGAIATTQIRTPTARAKTYSPVVRG